MSPHIASFRLAPPRSASLLFGPQVHHDYRSVRTSGEGLFIPAAARVVTKCSAVQFKGPAGLPAVILASSPVRSMPPPALLSTLCCYCWPTSAQVRV